MYAFAQKRVGGVARAYHSVLSRRSLLTSRLSRTWCGFWGGN